MSVSLAFLLDSCISVWLNELLPEIISSSSVISLSEVKEPMRLDSRLLESSSVYNNSYSSLMISGIGLKCSLLFKMKVILAFLSKHFWNTATYYFSAVSALTKWAKFKFAIPMALSLLLKCATNFKCTYFSPKTPFAFLDNVVTKDIFSLNLATLFDLSTLTFLFVLTTLFPLRN